MDRIRSGNAQLDSILDGGLPANAINLLIGEPGTGKTVLADQYVFQNATEERPAIYYSTVSEPLDKLMRYGQTLSFFRPEAMGKSVFFQPLSEELRAGGLEAVVKMIAEDIKTRRPGVMVIDSFRALAAFADPQAYRSFLADLAELLTAFPVTAFWVGEYTAQDIARAPEFAVCDSILSLSREDSGMREYRNIQVLKLRGSGFLAGKHSCRITEDGIKIFPRLADPGDVSEYPALTSRTSSGIPAVDGLVQRGFLSGSSTLVAGPAGSGKTLMGLHFILAGISTGQPGIIATLQENPTQLGSIAQGFGWSLNSEGLHLRYTSAVDLYIDEWIHGLLDTIEETGARRVVIDSLGDVQSSSRDSMQFHEFVYSFIQRCAREGVSNLLTLELPELFEVKRLTENSFSHLADNVVLLRYIYNRSRIKRTLTVIKSRGTYHDPGVHEFEITGDGIVLKRDSDDETSPGNA